MNVMWHVMLFLELLGILFNIMGTYLHIQYINTFIVLMRSLLFLLSLKSHALQVLLDELLHDVLEDEPDVVRVRGRRLQEQKHDNYSWTN